MLMKSAQSQGTENFSRTHRFRPWQDSKHLALCRSHNFSPISGWSWVCRVGLTVKVVVKCLGFLVQICVMLRNGPGPTAAVPGRWAYFRTLTPHLLAPASAWLIGNLPSPATSNLLGSSLCSGGRRQVLCKRRQRRKD